MATSERQLTFNRRLQRELEKRQHRLEASSVVEGVVIADSTPSPFSILFEESCEMVGLGGLLFCGILIGAGPEQGDRFLLVFTFIISCVFLMCGAGIDWSYVSSLTRLFFKGGRTNSTSSVTKANSFSPTPTNVRIYLKCIAAACNLEDEDEDEVSIYYAAKNLYRLLEHVDNLRQRLDRLVSMNDIGNSSDWKNMIDDLECVIAIEIHRAINVLIGCDGVAFIDAAATTEQKCDQLLSAAEEGLQALVTSLNQYESSFKVPAGLQSIIDEAGADYWGLSDDHSDDYSDDDSGSAREDQDDDLGSTIEDQGSSEDDKDSIPKTFAERLRIEVKRRLPDFDSSDDGYVCDLVDRFDDAINERNRHWVATLVCGSVMAFSLLCYVASIVGMYVLDGTMSALVYALTVTFALAAVFYEAYYQKKNKEAVQLQEAINQHTMSRNIQMTPHSVRLYIKCILASCIAPDDDDIKEAAQRLKAMFGTFDVITERYLSLSKLNDIIAKEEVENLLAAAEEAIATQAHHAINTLIGGSEADFVEKGVPRAIEGCAKINASLNKTLQSLVGCVNRDQGERKVLSEIESLTTAYRQFAERDFPTLKDCSPSDDSLAEASCDDHSPAQDSSDSSDECLAWKIP
ncbi:hypothetical protein IJJ39_01620 [Candidatus Saccharibacteria bacterium]|nr:hypothetical protein [Candidatus Saccharibacteria bacterium]